MAANTVQIEVCDQIVKVCCAVKKGKKLRVSDAFLFQTPEGCVLDGVILNPAALSEELKNQLDAHGLGRVKNVEFALTSNKIAVREARLPQMKPKLIGSAIRTNAEEYFPVDLENYHIAYSVLESIPGADGFIRVMAYAAPISLLLGYSQLAEGAGLTVKGLDCAGNAQYQALKNVNSAQSVTIFVDAGTGSSVISFMLGDRLLMQRAFAFGADELVTHYQTASGHAEDDYLGALRETDITSASFAAANVLSAEDAQDDLGRFVGGIVRTIDFFNSSKWDSAATRVVLAGPLRHIYGLREQLADATGLETDFLDDLPEFAAFTGAEPDAAAYLACIGSILAPLDLVSCVANGGKPAVPTGALTPKLGLILCAVCVVAAVLMAVLSVHNYTAAQQQVADTQKQIDALAPAKKAYDTYVSYTKSQKDLNKIIDLSKTPNEQLKAFFTELEAKMPSSILLLSADCTDEGIAMNITVANYSDAAAAVAELREFTSIADLQVSEVAQADSDTGASRVSFSVTCTYGKNPYLNSLNPYQSVIAPSPSPSADASASPEASAGGDNA